MFFILLNSTIKIMESAPGLASSLYSVYNNKQTLSLFLRVIRVFANIL